jgi:hypothetical protein
MDQRSGHVGHERFGFSVAQYLLSAGWTGEQRQGRRRERGDASPAAHQA